MCLKSLACKIAFLEGRGSSVSEYLFHCIGSQLHRFDIWLCLWRVVPVRRVCRLLWWLFIWKQSHPTCPDYCSVANHALIQSRIFKQIFWIKVLAQIFIKYLYLSLAQSDAQKIQCKRNLRKVEKFKLSLILITWMFKIYLIPKEYDCIGCWLCVWETHFNRPQVIYRLEMIYHTAGGYCCLLHCKFVLNWKNVERKIIQ